MSDEPMHILILSTHREKCGIATYNDALVACLKSQGADVTIHAIDTQALKKKSRTDLLRSFATFLQRIDQYDAVIVQHEYGLFKGQFTSGTAQQVFFHLLEGITAAGVPAIIFCHTAPPPTGLNRLFSRRRRFGAAITRTVNRNPHILVAVHGEDSWSKFRDAGYDDRRLWRIEHPFPDIVQLKRVEQDDSTTLTIFGFVARYKGYVETIEALKMLPSSYRLCVAGGEHPEETNHDTMEMLKAANQTGPTAGRIEITGWLDDSQMIEVFARSDIVLADYGHDGPSASGAVTWAICNGRPVIASATPTFQRLQDQADCFELVAPNDPVALRNAIVALNADPARQRQIVENGLEFARDNSWNALASNVLRRLQDLRTASAAGSAVRK